MKQETIKSGKGLQSVLTDKMDKMEVYQAVLQKETLMQVLKSIRIAKIKETIWYKARKRH
jgi:hypothetical protein